MARTRNIDISKVSEGDLIAARKQAVAKAARMMAEQELGISDSDMPVVKGPMPVKDEKQCEITLDLAPHSDRLVIDGVIYMQGRSYTVGQRLFDTMREMQSRGWQHQEEIDGKDRNFYRKSKTVKLTPGAAGMASDALLRSA